MSIPLKVKQIQLLLSWFILINVGATPEKLIILDRAHVLIGKSLLDKIGNFSKLKIKNGTSSNGALDANVRILVGRDV